MAQTIVAATSQSASPTPTSSFNPLPAVTPIPPSATPTAAPAVTATPTEPPTPFADDFSADRGGRTECRSCSWDRGTLLLSPYAPWPRQDERLAVSVPWGPPKFFRIAVDVMHIQGETDRGCGLLFWADDQDLSVGEISPLILLTVAVRYTKGTRLFELLNPNIHQLLTGQVRLGKVTDHLEVEIQPVGS